MALRHLGSRRGVIVLALAVSACSGPTTIEDPASTDSRPTVTETAGEEITTPAEHQPASTVEELWVSDRKAAAEKLITVTLDDGVLSLAEGQIELDCPDSSLVVMPEADSSIRVGVRFPEAGGFGDTEAQRAGWDDYIDYTNRLGGVGGHRIETEELGPAANSYDLNEFDVVVDFALSVRPWDEPYIALLNEAIKSCTPLLGPGRGFYAYSEEPMVLPPLGADPGTQAGALFEYLDAADLRSTPVVVAEGNGAGWENLLGPRLRELDSSITELPLVEQPTFALVLDIDSILTARPGALVVGSCDVADGVLELQNRGYTGILLTQRSCRSRNQQWRTLMEDAALTEFTGRLTEDDISILDLPDAASYLALLTRLKEQGSESVEERDPGSYSLGSNTAWWLHMILAPVAGVPLPLNAAIVASAHQIQTTHPAYAGPIETSPKHNLSVQGIYVITDSASGSQFTTWAPANPVICRYGDLRSGSPSKVVRC